MNRSQRAPSSREATHPDTHPSIIDAYLTIINPLKWATSRMKILLALIRMISQLQDIKEQDKDERSNDSLREC